MKTEEVIRIIKNWGCPACGPDRISTISGTNTVSLCPFPGGVCGCCGRIYRIINNDISIEVMTPIAGQEYPYRCSIEHPGHKWPIEYDNPEAEPLTGQEKLMKNGEPIGPDQFECCDIFKEMKDQGHALYIDSNDDNNFAHGWYLAFVASTDNAIWTNYELRVCPSCGASVP
jgi:hypothetical protein